MDYEARFRAAGAELTRRGIWKDNAMPPMLRLLRAAGARPRPPHYNGFGINALATGAFFGPLWAAAIWLADWQVRDMPADLVLMMAVSAGAVFGFLMAGYYLYGQRRHRLTPWERLGEEGDDGPEG